MAAYYGLKSMLTGVEHSLYVRGGKKTVMIFK